MPPRWHHGHTPSDFFCCEDCGIDTKLAGELYMVQNHIWALALRIGRFCRILCVGCLEGRLSLKLRGIDFTECSLNDDPEHYRSLRLRDRLHR